MTQAHLTLGALFNKDLKHAAYLSKTWKLAAIAWQSDPAAPKLVRYKDHEYYAVSLKESESSFFEIRTRSEALKEELLKHLPELDEKEIKVYIFPQVLMM